ncbi:TrmH family RNA methyltransferase, partial [bacterium]|nr:TrmH family RNA methyltransferase [bacterium]
MNNTVLSELYEFVSASKRELIEQVSSERTKYLTVVLEDIVKEFNSSAVLRSCDCFGVQELNIIAENQEFEVLRDIARGAGNWVDINSYSGNNSPGIQCLTTLKKSGFK